MNLADTLKEIKQLKPLVDEDVDSGPVETLNGRRGRKAQAIEKTKSLKRDYRLGLLETAVFIIVTGENKDEFAKIATKNFFCFDSDPDEFYKDLAKRIPPVLYLGKSGATDVFDILGRHLEDKMRELDIPEPDFITYKQEFGQKIEKIDDVVAMAKKAINSQIGAEIVGIQAVTSLIDEAIKQNHDGGITPILLPTTDKQLILDLVRDLPRLSKTKEKTYVVSVGEVTKESVDRELKTIIKSIKSKKVKKEK